MKESLQPGSVVTEMWWKARGEEMKLVWISEWALTASAGILNLATGKDTEEFKLQK